MFCSKCGTETADDSQFCRKCGKSLTAISVGGGAAVAPAPVTAKPKTGVRTPFVVAGVAIALFLLFAAFNARRASIIIASQNANQPVRQPRTVTLDPQQAEVNAKSYYYVKLQVPPGGINAHLQGTFTASGGTGNDVQVYVLPEDDFVNWQNHHASKSYYNSGRVTVGTFSVNLPSDQGTYYVVFDNRFSVFSKKEVEVKGSLTYYQ